MEWGGGGGGARARARARTPPPKKPDGVEGPVALSQGLVVSPRRKYRVALPCAGLTGPLRVEERSFGDRLIRVDQNTSAELFEYGAREAG